MTKKNKLAAVFELNGKHYRTDSETLNVLRPIIVSAKRNSDGSAVIAMIAAGLHSGRIIVEIKKSGWQPNHDTDYLGVI